MYVDLWHPAAFLQMNSNRIKRLTWHKTVQRKYQNPFRVENYPMLDSQHAIFQSYVLSIQALLIFRSWIYFWLEEHHVLQVGTLQNACHSQRQIRGLQENTSMNRMLERKKMLCRKNLSLVKGSCEMTCKMR